ncbi:MAG: GNAT family N-acetyltransferase [Lachnospiraceae bacterium]|nr:GNAT family N-acetyltransferase [Lachnospiraceae bacterium]
MNIREIEAKDNAAVEGIIRSCLIEYGANHEGTAWADPDLGRFSEIYNSEGNKYWVAEREDGKIVAGVGIGRLKGAEGVCELQKMYCLPEGRGSGISHSLMDKALEYASCYYERCYLETLENMKAAQKFYEKYGFVRIYEPIVKTEHFECDVRYIKDLDSNKEKKQTAYRE